MKRSDDDYTSALAELEKIKKERAKERARKEQEQEAEEDSICMGSILSGNPPKSHWLTPTSRLCEVG